VYAQFLVAACPRLADPRHLVAIRHDVDPAEPARRSIVPVLRCGAVPEGD